MDDARDRELRAEPATGALLPRHVRHWVLAGVSVLLLAALYLIAVRGTAILFDLRDAVSAMCF